MKLKELLADIEVLHCTASPEMEIGGICYDSRAAKPGDIFVAITGFETDGHKYIASAVERGASAVICERLPETDIPCVQVRDSRLALALASATFFGKPAERMKMIGVTGTTARPPAPCSSSICWRQKPEQKWVSSVPIRT